jgi:ribosome maturation factor RimP
LEAVKDKLRDLLEEKFREESFQDCFVVDISISKSNKVQIYVDCDSGVNLKTCSQLSRYLEAYLDESLVLGEKYTLEVSSPGVDRPLIKRQYPKNVGRKIQLKLKEEKKVKGKLEAASDTGIEVLVSKGKKESEVLSIPYDDIVEAKIIVSF